MEDVECPLSVLRLQTTMCHVCRIIVSVFLIMNLYYLLNPSPHSSEAKRRLENSTQSPHAAARRQKEATAKTKMHTNATERRPFPPKRRTPATPEGSFEEHTLAHSHKRKKHTHIHTCAVTHTHTRLHRNISALFAKAETGDHHQIFRHHLKTSIVKKGMHSIDILFELAAAPVTCFMIVHLLFTYLSLILREDTAF